MVLSLFLALPWETSRAETADCSVLARSCPGPRHSQSFQQSFEIASRSCEIEQKALKCEELVAAEPELKSKVRRCSPQSLCEDSQKQTGMALRGCFWNAPGAWGTDVWESIKAGADKSQSCLKDSQCSSQVYWNMATFSSPLLLIWRAQQQPPIDLEKTKQSLTALFEGGRDWIKKKGVELQCFDRQAQMELICYGVLNVFAPGAALKAAGNAPRIVQLLKLNAVKNEKALEKAVDQSKRSGEVAARKTPASPRPVQRSEFIDQFLRAEVTTTEQNMQWIRLAGNLKPDGRTKFFEVENSVMKMLNDTTQDKNFVTALTNKQKQILKSKVDEFAALHPGVEILPYSDFKAMRFAIRPKPPVTSLPDSVDSKLAEAFKSANSEFTQYMKSNRLVRSTDRTEEWFRAGVGETADQATLASRYSRNISGENQLRNFADQGLHENLKSSLKATEMFRKELQADLQKTGLMEAVGSSQQMIFRKEVFEAVRKTSSPGELRESLEKSMGVRLNENQARKIRDYSELVDEFSPGLHVAKREIATLSDSAHGGLSVDFSGLGALNLKATAGALVKAEKIEDAVVQTRLAEKSVTEAFQDRKDSVRKTIQSILDRNGIQSEVISSGDDLVVKPSKPIPLQVRSEIAQELPKKIDPSAIRTSHVPDGISVPSDRMIIATHGETIEKLTRKNLQGQLPKEKLEQVLLMVDMNAKSSGSGSAQLIMGMGRSELNDIEKQKVKRAFEKAVQDLNQNLKKENMPANYQPAS